MTRANLKWTATLATTATVLALLWWGSQAFAPVAVAQVPQTDVVVDGFEATDYYPEPNHTQLRARIKAEKVNPYPGGRLLLSEMRLQVYQSNGTPAFSAQAPECVYDFTVGTASSTGKLHLASGDGRLSVQGEGFQWRQKSLTLTISNRVQTVLSNVVATKIKR